jgi:hypothetical protein
LAPRQSEKFLAYTQLIHVGFYTTLLLDIFCDYNIGLCPDTGLIIMNAPWTQSPQAILEHFGVHATSGLTPDQAAQNAEAYGKNGMYRDYS